jgi:hypothetical protein
MYLQLSDLHLSKFFDEARISDLKSFCEELGVFIRPEVVLITGLTVYLTIISLGEGVLLFHMSSNTWLQKWLWAKVFQSLMRDGNAAFILRNSQLLGIGLNTHSSSACSLFKQFTN